MKYESMVLCPDTSDTGAGYDALHEAIQDGWEVVCQWREPYQDRRPSSSPPVFWHNYIALRRPDASISEHPLPTEGSH